MSFMRALLARGNSAPTGAPDPARFESIESFALALMWAGTPTGEARERLREALRLWEAEQLRRGIEVDARARAVERLEALDYSAAAAAARLLREVGYRGHEDEPPTPTLARVPGSFMGPWLPQHDRQEATLHHDPLLDGPVAG
jgi:hypothetical protein